VQESWKHGRGTHGRTHRVDKLACLPKKIKRSDAHDWINPRAQMSKTSAQLKKKRHKKKTRQYNAALCRDAV
jgi:hypothetical protein